MVADDFTDFGGEESLVEAFGVAVEFAREELDGFGFFDGSDDGIDGLILE